VLIPPLCWGCAGVARRGEPLCLACRRTLRVLPTRLVILSGVCAWAPVAYEGAARPLVRALKFRGALALADAMAAQIAARAPEELLPPPARGPGPDRTPVLVPVPLHPRRLRRRGFNQAAALAQALARRSGLPLADCLVREGDSVTQVGRGRSERRAGPAGVVRMRPDVPAPPRTLLVDDVATTGATLAACGAALRTGGTLEVRAVTFARTLGR
jgi:ComF family protein